MSVESYKHKAAKAVFAGWLRDAAEAQSPGGFARFCELYWCHNRSKEDGFGVWEEYPVLADCLGVDPVWDEAHWTNPQFDGSVPTYEKLCGIGLPPKVIFDVAAQHKGMLTFAIEIVHKNGISEAKRAFLRTLDFQTFVIPADWILGQVQPPKNLLTIEVI